MGAEQSSSRTHAGDQNSSQSAPTRKTCYYEVLGIQRTATEDEIKKAYRRKALELHPDRNYGDVENATKLFAEVQAANEVLSDPQERAWYDSHREAILRNDDSAQDEHYEQNIRLTSTTDIVKLMAKFNSSVPFTDAPSGFYGSLAVFFETLAEEEALALELEGSDPVEYPEFGKASSSYEDVVRPFYSIWIGFGTKKSYSWKDQYRLSDAPDRRTRRAMEKENKRLRDEGIREFNDAVRSLVTFVRKRDPRYLPNTQTEAERQKVLRGAASAQAARSRAANKAKIDMHVIPDWAQARDEEEQEHFGFSEDSEESEVEHIECVVCNKTFKSEKQYEAHEKSKKHVKAVQQLKRQMEKENKHLNLDQDMGSCTSTSLSTPPAETKEPADDFGGMDDDIDEVAAAEESAEAGSDHDGELGKEGCTPHLEPVNKSLLTSDDSSELDENDEYAPREDIQNRILGHQLEPLESDQGFIDDVEQITTTTATISIAGESDSLPKAKLGKAKAKRAKRAARQEEEKQEGLEYQCVACSDSFASKTKLFNHIKEYGHAAPISKTGKGGKGKRR